MTTRREPRVAPGWRIAAWFLGIVGGIATFLGLFILLGGEDQSIGIGGDWSWTVGEISSAWGWGLFIGGLALMLIALATVLFSPRTTRRAGIEGRAELLWHAGIFVLVNAFIWIQDIAIGGGVDYAYWVTIPWGIGLIAHTTTYLVQRRKAPLAAPESVEESRELQHH